MRPPFNQWTYDASGIYSVMQGRISIMPSGRVGLNYIGEDESTSGTVRVTVGGNLHIVGGGIYADGNSGISGNLFLNGSTYLQTLSNKNTFLKEGNNCSMGLVSLVNGTATVAMTKLTANSRVFLTVQNVPNGTIQGHLSLVKTPGVGFTVNSTSASDNSQLAYIQFEGN